DFYLQLLEAELDGSEPIGADDAGASIAALHRQVPFRRPKGDLPRVLTVSGGVGELIYAHLRGKPWPPTTHFGDFGIELAQRLVAVPEWRRDFERFSPASAGRATVYGLLRYNTEVSGSTLFLPRPELLPLADLPLVGAFGPETSDAHVTYLLELAA